MSAWRSRHHQPASPRASDRGCPGRSGWGKASERERSPPKEPRRGASLMRPLARDKLGWPRIASRGNTAREEQSHLPFELHARATSRGVGRVRTVRRSCSRARFVCRSRRAARGPSSDAGEQPAPHEGSSFGSRERAGVNAGRKLIARRQSRRMSGGLPRGSTRRWKAPRVEEAIVVDATVGDAVLACRRKRKARAFVSTGQATVGVRDRSTYFARGRERRGEGASRKRGRHPKHRDADGADRSKLWARRPSGSHSGQGCQQWWSCVVPSSSRASAFGDPRR